MKTVTRRGFLVECLGRCRRMAAQAVGRSGALSVHKPMSLQEAGLELGRTLSARAAAPASTRKENENETDA